MLTALTYVSEDPSDFGAETSKSDKTLLSTFKPRIFIAPGGRRPVDFYGFYLPKTAVKNEKGAIVKKNPTRAYLKTIERNAGFYLDYEGPDRPCEGRACEGYVGTGYGRVYREDARFFTKEGVRKIPLTILKYNFAFTYSGLPAAVGQLKELPLSLFIDPAKIHELDIHGAVHIVLNGQKRPIALILAEHNYFRTFVFGDSISKMPRDKRVKICFAQRSNEPYPCPAGAAPLRRRTVGSPADISYVINGGEKPFFSGEDIIYGPESGAQQVKYVLKSLPKKDPLYVSWIPLGNKEKILFYKSYYIQGPPGMDMNTWPKKKKYSDIMQFWYFREDSSEDAALMGQYLHTLSDGDLKRVLEHNGERLYNDIAIAERKGGRD